MFAKGKSLLDSKFKMTKTSEAKEDGGDTLVKGGKKRASVPTRRLLSFLMPLLWPANSISTRIYMFLALVFMVASRAVSIATPIVLKIAVDSLIGSMSAGASMSSLIATASAPVAAIVGYVALRVVKSFFDETRSAVFGLVSLHSTRTAAVQTFRHLHELSLTFHTNRQTGAVMRTLDRGADAVSQLLQYLVFNLVPTQLELIITIFVLFGQFDYRFALVTFAMLVLYVGFTYRVTEWRTNLRKKANDAQNNSSNRATDSLLNFETVKVFNAEGYEATRYDDAYVAYNKTQVSVTFTLAFLNFGQQLIIGGAMLACLLLMANDIVSGHDGDAATASSYTTGSFVMLQAYLLQLSTPLGFLGSTWRFVRTALVDLEQLVQLYDEQPNLTDADDAEPLVCDKAEIEFKNVHFSYEANRDILKGISFKVPSGKSCALVGKTGSGKSTITRLLLRFYDVTGGSIEIDGQDVRNVTQQSLRRAFAVVPQNSVLFNDTIFNNILYGNRNATNEQVYAAARQAQLHDFIVSLPKGYDTICGERGLRLSGGELQRTAIARALLKNPKILVLDEASSALDSRTERQIQQALLATMKGRTSLVVAHRLGTIVSCDQIIVLGEGEIIERGTHTELLQLNGTYAEMWRQQLEKSEENGDQASASAATTTSLVDL